MTAVMSSSSEELTRDRLGRNAVGAYRNIADKSDPVQDAVALDVLEVARCEVQCGAVVPERDTARFPLEPHRVLGTSDLLEQQIQHMPALPRRQIDDLAGEGR